MTAISGDRPSLLSGLIELVLPRACVGCGDLGTAWCPTCLRVDFDPVLHRPDPCPPGLPPLTTAATYSGSVRRAVLAAKERDRRELDRSLGAMLAAAIGLLITSQPEWPSQFGQLWLVPVPASRSARRERGRDHVSDWTRWTVRFLQAADIPARSVTALRRTTAGLDSVGLAADARAVNLRGAFSVGPVRRPPPDAMVVITDDIVTTGATLVAASTCLSAGLDLGPSQLGAVVVAATQRDRTP
ncbi:MAG: ComF family protein [Actinomycetota bacterium]|nr:ComF family protein [Actinomycetota bacterium]